MQAVFYGVGAAVIGVIAMSAKKLTEKTLGADKLLWGVYLTLAAVTIVTESEVAWLFIAGGALVWLLRAPPKWLDKRALGVAAIDQAPVTASWLGSLDLSLLSQIAIFFGKAGAFVFGSGLAIVPFLYGGVVTENHWLTERQFVDAVAVAMITPGPVVITVGFIGYLIAGFGGATVAALATFIPCYLFTIIPAPYFKRYGRLPGVVAFVDGITAAAIGAITGSVVVLARRSIIDIPTGIVALVTVVVLWRFKKLQEPVIIAAAAAAGLILYPLMHS
jgi:chromate transporter